MTELIGKSLGRYHILERLGEGGMAVVYKAYDTRLESEVAIKVIRTEKLTIETMGKSLKRFEREAKALAQLTHPNIVGVMDYGEFEGKPYIVMPYLRGGTLKKNLGRPMSYRQAAAMLAPIARALAYAHQHNVLHRDVKPSNILLTDTGQPMLSDFGIAKILEEDLTNELTGTGVGIGTPEYMAPEQGMGHEIDHRADVYSLGTVFYEMVTGRKPFQADTPLAVLLKRASEPLPSPRQFVRNLPSSVEYVMLKALAKSPNDRYPDADAFAKALEDLSQGQLSISQSPSSTLTSIKKYWIFPVLAIACSFIGILGWTVKNFGGNNNTFSPTSSSPHQSNLTPSSTKALETATQLAILPTVTVSEFTELPILTTVEPTASGNFGKDGMMLVYVSEGEFIMGSNGGDPDEQPPHIIYLSSYWIDRTEITNAMYAQFLNEMGNQSEGGADWINLQDIDVRITSIGGLWQPERGYENLPVVEVTWYGANAYCTWAGRRLPTEAEWEKAARGDTGETLPWGGSLDCSHANYGNCVGKLTAVGSYPLGESPYGVLDAFGNVWEWVYDRYDTEYYKHSPSFDPSGPDAGKHRILRGAGWDTSDTKRLRITFRYNREPSISANSYGFRCAMSAP